MSWSHLYRAVTALIFAVFLSAPLGFEMGRAAETGGSSSDYIPDASYYLLMAEIAIQRKEYLTAAEEYSNAAAQSTDPELAGRAAEFAFEYGYDAFALSGVRRWLSLDPENRLAHEYAARLHFRRHDFDQALDHWRIALGPVDERSEEDYFSLGADLGEENDAVGVTRLLSRLAADAPDSPALRLVLGQAALRSGAYDLALGSAGLAARGAPEWVEPEILRARALLSSGAEYQALEVMEALLSRQPSLGIELEFVRLLAASGRNTRAMETLRDLVKKYGVYPELVRLHGLLSLSVEDTDAAERDFKELARRSENVYESLFYLGQIAQTRGDYRDSIRLLGRVLGGPYLFPAQLNIASAYSSLGEYQAGIDHLQKFAVKYPHYAVDSLQPQALLLQQMGRTDEALATYDLILRFAPRNVELLVLKAVLLEESGDLGAGMKVMREAVAIAPYNAGVLNTLGYTLVNRTRRHAEGYRLIRLALELQPESPAIVDSMGWALYRLGRLEEARSYLELAYSLMEDPELVAHLGELLWVTGEQERATELWNSAIVTFPDSKPLNSTREKYLQ
jgi:tetratricopeptide (TPR) repeat protein